MQRSELEMTNRMRMAQAARGSHTLAQCQARRGSSNAAWAGARHPNTRAMTHAKQPPACAMEGATRNGGRGKGRCDAARIPKREKSGFPTSTRKSKIKSQDTFIKE
ncbi:hypothetical protein HAX54_022775 [Datura stramonium]|uniref:Uncharacterized protein n=1 Tax=Datura stramonium TaxID=4076 RepID=A0ABS8S4B6_DATST|nr:hypothetical protein [Datura stramonium]